MAGFGAGTMVVSSFCRSWVKNCLSPGEIKGRLMRVMWGYTGQRKTLKVHIYLVGMRVRIGRLGEAINLIRVIFLFMYS